MKKKMIFLALLVCLLVSATAMAQNDTIEQVRITDSAFVQRMIWSADGSTLTVVSADNVTRIPVSGNGTVEKYAAETDDTTFVSVSEDGLAAAVSSDGQLIFLYEPGSAQKDMVTVETGFKTLSVSLSEDGSQLLADSADEIRTVVYNTKDGSMLFDLEGFSTAAPVYDSTLSRDGLYVVWHSRGTFAVQNTADETFGEVISLWDFVSAYDIAPDDSTLAVGIINDDYESGAVIFFDPQSGAELGRVLLGKTGPYALSYSADGSALWAADSGNIYLIDPETFTLKDKAEVFGSDSENRIIRIAASPDGTQAALLTSAGNMILVH